MKGGFIASSWFPIQADDTLVKGRPPVDREGGGVVERVWATHVASTGTVLKSWTQCVVSCVINGLREWYEGTHAVPLVPRDHLTCWP